MDKRGEQEHAAALGLRDAARALRDVVLGLHATASDVARWGEEDGEAEAMWTAIGEARARLADAEAALGVWTAHAEMDGAVDG